MSKNSLVTSLDQLEKVAVHQTEIIEITGWGDFKFRSLSEREVKNLPKMKGKIVLRPDKSQEFDLSQADLFNDSVLFGRGWVDENDKDVIEFKNKNHFERQLHRLSSLPVYGLREGAAVVRRLSHLTDEEDSDEKKETS